MEEQTDGGAPLVGGVWPRIQSRDVEWAALRVRHWVRLQLQRGAGGIEVRPKAIVSRGGYVTACAAGAVVLASIGRGVSGTWAMWRGAWLVVSGLAVVAWMVIWAAYARHSRLQREQSEHGALVRLDIRTRLLGSPRLGREIPLASIRRVAVHEFLASPDDEDGVYLVHRLRLMIEEQGMATCVDVMDASSPSSRRILGKMAAEIARACGVDVQRVRQSGTVKPGRQAAKAPPASGANPA